MQTLCQSEEDYLVKISSLSKILAVLIWFIIWEILFRIIGREILVVSPFNTFLRIIELGQTAVFWRAIHSTMSGVMEGFFHAIWVGSIMAVLTYKFYILKVFFAPFLGIVRATPVASIIILALVWLAVSRIPIFIVFLMVIPIIWTNLEAGLNAIDKNLLEMADIFKLSRLKRIRYIYIASLMPYIVSALITGLGVAWKTAVGAEVIARPAGTMGRHVYDARIHLQTLDLFAWTVCVILLSILLEKIMIKLLDYLSRRIMV